MRAFTVLFNLYQDAKRRDETDHKTEAYWIYEQCVKEHEHLQRQLAEARAATERETERADKAEAKAERRRVLLEEIQWESARPDDGGYRYLDSCCPCCEERQPKHAPDCALAREIADTPVGNVEGESK